MNPHIPQPIQAQAARIHLKELRRRKAYLEINIQKAAATGKVLTFATMEVNALGWAILNLEHLEQS